MLFYFIFKVYFNGEFSSSPASPVRIAVVLEHGSLNKCVQDLRQIELNEDIYVYMYVDVQHITGRIWEDFEHHKNFLGRTASYLKVLRRLWVSGRLIWTLKHNLKVLKRLWASWIFTWMCNTLIRGLVNNTFSFDLEDIHVLDVQHMNGMLWEDWKFLEDLLGRNTHYLNV